MCQTYTLPSGLRGLFGGGFVLCCSLMWQCDTLEGTSRKIGLNTNMTQMTKLDMCTPLRLSMPSWSCLKFGHDHSQNLFLNTDNFMFLHSKFLW